MQGPHQVCPEINYNRFVAIINEIVPFSVVEDVFEEELAGLIGFSLPVFNFSFRYFSFRFRYRNHVKRLEINFLMNIVNGYDSVVQYLFA